MLKKMKVFSSYYYYLKINIYLKYRLGVCVCVWLSVVDLLLYLNLFRGGSGKWSADNEPRRHQRAKVVCCCLQLKVYRYSTDDRTGPDWTLGREGIFNGHIKTPCVCECVYCKERERGEDAQHVSELSERGNNNMVVYCVMCPSCLPQWRIARMTSGGSGLIAWTLNEHWPMRVHRFNTSSTRF